MSFFTSSREKRLWIYAFLVLVAIFSTLIFGGHLVEAMDEELQGALFFYTMLALAATVILHGLFTRPGMAEITVWLGLSAVFIMLYARLGFAERSHLFEYCVLAIFIHKALLERTNQGKIIANPGLVAFLITLAIGTFDELIQIFLPDRVFDPLDILVNGLSAFLAIAGSWTLSWAKNKFG
jgi:hypothetical protein